MAAEGKGKLHAPRPPPLPSETPARRACTLSHREVTTPTPASGASSRQLVAMLPPTLSSPAPSCQSPCRLHLHADRSHRSMTATCPLAALIAPSDVAARTSKHHRFRCLCYLFLAGRVNASQSRLRPCMQSRPSISARRSGSALPSPLIYPTVVSHEPQYIPQIKTLSSSPCPFSPRLLPFAIIALAECLSRMALSFSSARYHLDQSWLPFVAPLLCSCAVACLPLCLPYLLLNPLAPT